MAKGRLFLDEHVRMDLLRQRAYNHRWAELPPDVIALTAADSDFPVAPAICEAIVEYVRGGVLSYGPPEGLPSFRRAAAQALRLRKGYECPWEQILATDSAAAAMYVAARFALRPGDEAIIFDPVDFLFRSSVEAAGGAVRTVPIAAQHPSFSIDAVRAAITPRTRLLGVCNPHNPLGLVHTREELLALGELAVEHDLWILSDEVWSDIVYTPHRHVAMAALGPEIARRTLGVYGLSKSFGLAGLRIGFLAAPDPETFEALVEASRARSTASGAATLSQIAAQAAYESAGPWLDAFLAHLASVRDYAVARLDGIEGVSCRAPEGTFLLFPDVRALGRPVVELVAHLRDVGRVAVVPGAPRWFGPGADGHLRIAFATSHAIIRDGLDRIEAALKGL